MEQISGMMLFLRYVWPCAWFRVVKGKMNMGDFNILKRAIELNEELCLSFLQRCFPEPFKRYREFCIAKRIVIDYSFASVAEFWRHHHKSNTPVIIALVTEITKDKISVISNSKTFEVSNPFRHPLEEMLSTASIHCDMIIEVIE